MSQRDLIIAGVFSVLVFLGVMFVSFGDKNGTGPAAGVNQFLSQIVSYTLLPECSDGRDNDNDGAVDYPIDFSCSGPKDNNEQLPWPECFDGHDNDDDSMTDTDDPQCSNAQDNDESRIHQCSDLADNDGDELIDMRDPGCSSPSDDNESNAVTSIPRIRQTQCNDLIDNDLDGWVDLADIGCTGPSDNSETNPQCSDNLDNDGDNLTDMNDPGCSSDTDGDEFNATVSGSVLDPGEGFNGPTPQPAAMGNATQQGFDATPIAHWDVVPHQTITNSINIGVLAYHFNNIAYVDFSVEGGPWTRVTQASRNPQTDAEEYWVTLRASDFEDDGQVEIRAIAYPNVGQPKVLQGDVYSHASSALFLNVNANGTLPHAVRYVKTTGNDNNSCMTESQACRTILRALASAQINQGSLDGAEIRLGAGDWQIPRVPGGIFDGRSWVPSYRTSTQWLTITSAPSTDKDHVFITGVDASTEPNNLGDWGLGLRHIRFEDVSVVGHIDKSLGNDWYKDYIWFDNSKMFYRNPQIVYQNACGGAFHGAGDTWVGSYYTDVWMDNVCDGPKDAGFVRNVHVERSGSGHASGAATVVNYTTGIIYGSGYPFPWGTGPDYHGDLYQFQGRREDVILYHLRTTPGAHIDSRGIAGYMNANIAIVDSVINTSPNWSFSACNPIDHMVIKDSIFTGGATSWCGEIQGAVVNPLQIRNVLIDHSVWNNGMPERLMLPWNLPGIRYVPAR